MEVRPFVSSNLKAGARIALHVSLNSRECVRAHKYPEAKGKVCARLMYCCCLSYDMVVKNYRSEVVSCNSPIYGK